MLTPHEEPVHTTTGMVGKVVDVEEGVEGIIDEESLHQTVSINLPSTVPIPRSNSSNKSQPPLSLDIRTISSRTRGPEASESLVETLTPFSSHQSSPKLGSLSPTRSRSPQVLTPPQCASPLISPTKRQFPQPFCALQRQKDVLSWCDRECMSKSMPKPMMSKFRGTASFESTSFASHTMNDPPLMQHVSLEHNSGNNNADHSASDSCSLIHLKHGDPSTMFPTPSTPDSHGAQSSHSSPSKLCTSFSCTALSRVAFDANTVLSNDCINDAARRAAVLSPQNPLEEVASILYGSGGDDQTEGNEHVVDDAITTTWSMLSSCGELGTESALHNGHHQQQVIDCHLWRLTALCTANSSKGTGF